ncbi:FxsA family protein [Xenorhabdus nematophila]|uniref:Suppress F exclusion of bacteriophage T7 n=1 Tax=Xenorhabdus nematophila (strain ATCC 19061 / DSM 3370 / CCUG 14189 / LMG 1036 / NCIMB 9965 / AN6) TaxID=406817 RepID=D3VA70_XENNA|nr:FxsA family protein [Xenorhabdus nematophila]CEE91865.1 suppress F exclusion of bacteriophage T7 [Xenorhabdus nematophila str. Anatoliense]CEF28635.1 suppress F exclusion of bacteriophage T7 [Xenorhabdus nematophila str. Websteri]AYA39321.1 membrane protein FxsA [Xenorhabdus nematophila]KHD28026.1 exclusion suppressor FxsA [Xenorhabdus nematophila]MBA0017900.1 FxsA family protein [Xenorhabdus nematophila]
MRWLPLILICLLIYIESVLFVRIASEVGVLLTLLLVILTSCLGVSLVRNQGIKNFMSMQQKIATGESPAAEAVKSVSLVISGFLLILPGFFTDFLGLLLLLSPVQKLLTAKLLPHLKFYRPNTAYGSNYHGDSGQNGQTFEGEYERRQDDASYTLDNHHTNDKKKKNEYGDNHDDKK